MELILILMGVAGVVWGTITLLRGGLLAGALMLMVAGTCFGPHFFSLPVPPIPITADRLLFLVLGAQYVLWRLWGRADPKPIGKAEIFLLAFIGILALSCVRGEGSGGITAPASRFLFYYLMPTGVYWIVRQTKIHERQIRWAWVVLGVLGVYLAATGVAEWRHWYGMVFPRYIVADLDAEWIGRARGPLLNPMVHGFMICVAMCGMLMAWPRSGWRGRVGLSGVTGLLMVGVFATLTRSVWLGAAGALFVVIALSMPKRLRVPVLGGCVIFGALALATNWESFMGFKRDKGLSAKETRDSAKLRPVLARVAWSMFLERPLFGCGYTRYKDRAVYYLVDQTTDLPLEKARGYVQHNTFLSLLTETGLIGVGLFSLTLCLWTSDGWQLWRARSAPLWARQQGLVMLAVMVVYMANAMFHDVALIDMFNMFLFFTAGLTAAMRPHRFAAEARSQSRFSTG